MQNKIPEEVIQQVRQANDIVDVISEYVTLKKQGKNFIGLCPFHGEKTPSFSVTQEKQIFHCFGCGKGGNVFTFLMEMEDDTFMESLARLAERSDIKLPESNRQEENSIMTEESKQVLHAYDWLRKLYQHLLKHSTEGKDGYRYLQDRNISDETIEAFELGFAPDVKDFTAEFLTKKGFHEQMLIKEGLLSRQEDNSVTDRFRGRVIFPIRNHLGKTVAFAGRTIMDREPKYLNSPESDLFQKSKLLYNFDLAKKHIRKQSEAILFEGYMDVIASYQADLKNGIATMGTALTEYQAKLIRRYADQVIICFDSDDAGIEGSYKAAVMLRQAGCRVKVARIKDGMDPDQFLRTYGSSAFEKEVIQTSDSFIRFYMQYLKKDYQLNTEDGRMGYLAEILREIARNQSPVERESHLKELSGEFDISMESLQAEMHVYQQNMSHGKDKSGKDSNTNNTPMLYKKDKLLPAHQNAERQLIAYMLHDRRIAEHVQETLGASFTMEEHKIIITHLYAFYEEGNPADVSLFIDRIEDAPLRKAVAEIAMLPVHKDLPESEINDYIRIIDRQQTDMASINALKEERKRAEQASDPIKAAEIAAQIVQIQRQLKRSN